ncbi:MAG: hypothetical protein J6A69_09835 [Clostridia bacterium]|nr:hypothetical protein [Clostridia bacterium]
MNKIFKTVTFFSVGGIGYGIIEILWRGYTHWCMLIAGGICFVNFSYIAEKFKRRCLLFKAMLCAFNITAVEMLFGFVFNICLKKKVWDYSNQPLNFLGQICPLYTFLWGILGAVFIPLAETLNKKIR